ncbi:hypothetical protein BHE74_00029805 [Ensete ventricosum]|nr:hypothetical protein BHE74_00029805 [Ensete ventricosum]
MFISCCNSTNTSCASTNTVQWPSRLCGRRRNRKLHRFLLRSDHRPNCADVSLADSADHALLFSGSSWARRTTWDETSAATSVERRGWAVLTRNAICGLTACAGSPGGCAPREASEEDGGHHLSPAPESGPRGGSELRAPAARSNVSLHLFHQSHRNRNRNAPISEREEDRGSVLRRSTINMRNRSTLSLDHNDLPLQLLENVGPGSRYPWAPRGFRAGDVGSGERRVFTAGERVDRVTEPDSAAETSG